MSRINSAIYEIHHMDALASRDQWVNRIHPLIKFILTAGYIAVLASFSRYDVLGVAGMAVYPAAVFILAELSFRDGLRRLRVVLPLVCLVGALNILFDKNVILVGGLKVRAGILSMAALALKGALSVFATYLLLATTTLEGLCYALRMLHCPKTLVTQFMLTYRYITVLLEEAGRITQAYALRAPGQRGIHFRVWGPLAGQLLLRSMDRADDVYESMLLRGYRGEYGYVRERILLKPTDALYFLLWAGIFLLLRVFPAAALLGALGAGVK